MAQGAELAKSGKFLKNTGPMPAHFCGIITAHYLLFVKGGQERHLPDLANPAVCGE
jgi:hypothetical protein